MLKRIKLLVAATLLFTILWGPGVSQAEDNEVPVFIIPVIIFPVYPDAPAKEPDKEEASQEPRKPMVTNSVPPDKHCVQLNDVFQYSDSKYDYYNRNWDCNLYTDKGQVYKPSINKMFLNFDEMSFEQPPIIIQGNTLIPLRKIAESLSTQVDWEPESKTITLKTITDVITLQLDNPTMKVNGKELTLEVPPTTVNGVTFVPVRAIAESLGAAVSFDSENQKTSIQSKIKGKVTEVSDGGFLKINTGTAEETVRFNYLSIPAAGTDPERAHPYAKQTLEYIRSSLMDKMVELELDGVARDKENRLYAYVWVDGNLFNQQLLKEGYAEISEDNHRGRDIRANLSQKEAVNLKKGIWSDQMKLVMEGEKTNRNLVMSGFMSRVSKGSKPNESIVIMDIMGKDTWDRYNVLSENTKKEVIYDSILKNISLTENADTALVTLTYNGKTYAEAVIGINKTLEACTYRFYNEGK